MNRARRRGIENEQKGPSCLDRNVKIIGRALSTGRQWQRRVEGGPKDVPPTFDCPSPPRCPCPVERHGVSQDAVEDKRGTLSRARIVHVGRSKDFPREVSFKRWVDSSKHPLGRRRKPIPRRGFLGYWGEISANLLTYLTILEIVSINLSEFWQFSRAFFRRSLPLFVTRVFSRG